MIENIFASLYTYNADGKRNDAVAARLLDTINHIYSPNMLNAYCAFAVFFSFIIHFTIQMN